ncbi:MAG: hypothetical protein OXN26_01575 [Gammaproteobacteria bacterium]|nr:hypothetical protein [Gammaproteobacteria bacterium]
MPISLDKFYSLVNHPDIHRDDVISVDRDGAPEVISKAKAELEAEKAKFPYRVSVADIERKNSRSIEAFISSLEQVHGKDSEFMNRLDVMALRNLSHTGKPLLARHIRSVQNVESPRTRESRLISVGGGPRGITQASEEIKFLKKYRKDFTAIEKLSGKYNMTTMVMDKGKFDDMGRGTAWTEQNKGTVNTGAEIGYGERLSVYYRLNKKEILAELKAHPVARAMFKAALAEGKNGAVVVDRAALTRALQGREELQYFKNLLGELDDEELSGIYNLALMPETQVTGIDLSNPRMPLVETDTGKWPAGTVRLNTGTIVAHPLKPEQEDVLPHSYIGPMDPEKVKTKLGEKELLDEQQKLIPGARILTGGSGLSLYDQLLALHPVMDLFEEDETSMTGYKVSDAAKKKYQGFILVTGNTPGKWISPRHSHSPEWTQKLDPIAGMKEQHALFLHGQGEEVYRSWQKIIEGTVVAATGRTPSQVRQDDLSTEQLLEEAHAETKKHAEAIKAADDDLRPEHTLYGARRQAYLASVLGYGMEKDLPAAINELSRMAPHTFKGRNGYLMHRAQLKGISEPGKVIAENNADMIQTFSTRMQDITASPFRVHEMMHMLMEAGIAKYTPGSYAGITTTSGEDHKALSFTDNQGKKTEHDFFLVSPTFQRQKDPVAASLEGQVDSIHPAHPSYGKVGMHRMLQTSGEPAHLEAHDLSGKGIRVSGQSTLGIFATDVNNKESAVQIAPGLAYRRFAQEAMAAAGFKNPVEEIDNLYEKHLPSNEAYQGEADKFQDHYHVGMRVAKYLEIIERKAKTPDEYQKLYEAGRTEEGRKLHGGEEYMEILKKIPAYSPSSK